MSVKRNSRAEEIVRSTAGVSAEERANLVSNACHGDAELRAEVERLLDLHHHTSQIGRATSIDRRTDSERATVGENSTRSDDDVPTIALSAEEQQELLHDQDIGPYRLIRQLGQGGMGAVYLAERVDAEYQKQVAIKLIKRGMDSQFILRRFRNERQILASLDHPNIARLLDGGTTRDGRPFFVMEYIDGKPIGQYCDDRILSTAQRIQLFRTVCSAVHYAHQNLVIHRDIKPGNILITADGTPKLLDFGIAKLLNPEGAGDTIDATAAAIRLMTPEYASPEQVKGELVTTATDVYSLGVVLYELLTGHRPYRLTSHAPQEIARVICGVEPERPSTAVSRTETIPTADGTESISLTPEEVSKTREGLPEKLRRRLRGDLDNIVLMAMRKEPARRYASVAQLSNDLERHLEGRPVSARPDTFWYRTGKFVRRNKLAVIAAAAIFITLIGGIVSTTIQERKAQRRFADVRQLANSFLFEFHDAIKDLPGSTPARELVVRKALEYLDRLAAESKGDAALQRELAAAYDKVGDLQGGLYQSNLGDTEGAQASYEKALRIREALAAAEPQNEEINSGLSNSYSRVGQLSWTRGDPAAAAEWHHKAKDIDERLAAADPGDQEKQYRLGASRLDYGFMLAASGKIQEGLQVLKDALPPFEALASSQPPRDKYRDGLATAYERIATVLAVGTSGRDEALEYYRKSLDIREALLASAPVNTDYRRGVAASYSNIGDTQLKIGDRTGAIESYRKAFEIMYDLSTSDPKNGQFRQDAAFISASIGIALAANGDGENALAYAKRAKDMLDGLVQEDPTSFIVRFRLAIAHESLGDSCMALASNGHRSTAQRKQYWTEARSWLQKAYDVDRELRDNGTIVGDEAARVDEIAARISQCDAALAKLK